MTSKNLVSNCSTISLKGRRERVSRNQWHCRDRTNNEWVHLSDTEYYSLPCPNYVSCSCIHTAVHWMDAITSHCLLMFHIEMMSLSVPSQSTPYATVGCGMCSLTYSPWGVNWLGGNMGFLRINIFRTIMLHCTNWTFVSNKRHLSRIYWDIFN